MGYEIIGGPFMLYETVAMLYRYVNQISFQSILNRQRLLQGAPVTKMLVRRFGRLQEIMEEVCQDVDLHDPLIQRYFGKVELDCEYICLAYLLTESFCTLHNPGFRETLAETSAIWKRYQAEGFWIRSEVTNILNFSDEPGCPGDLFVQVCEMNLPAEFRLQLYGALRDFERSIEQLAVLIEPLAQRLGTIYSQESWLLAETVHYWEETFSVTSPIEFLRSLDSGLIHGAGEHTRVAFSLMNSDVLFCNMAGESATPEEGNLLYIGCGVTTSSMPRKRGGDLESMSAILRALGDKKRLEILRRLSKDRLYCHELAEIMEIDPGNMSRNLAVLHNYGFLRQEREALRNYYQADRETLHNFLQLVETIIFG